MGRMKDLLIEGEFATFAFDDRDFGPDTTSFRIPAAGIDNAIDAVDAVQLPKAASEAVACHRPVAGVTSKLSFAACSIREVDGVDHIIDAVLTERDGDYFYTCMARPLGIYQSDPWTNDLRTLTVPTFEDFGTVFDAAAAELEAENAFTKLEQDTLIHTVAARFAAA